ncbi:hypothetical protein K435DRAFT_867370 [Dendrothele bispora CBS 962.96]|uniref:Uncharacterized protein n=1 Tax=Dendrothele bispora (strain CBS 962.96) TaxID=1314807 RepID=A0A4S8LEW6_DENBC|nr:hypothetical protein K435DRAFT_867370 [Dendrothele bispora CBS 962.96]
MWFELIRGRQERSYLSIFSGLCCKLKLETKLKPKGGRGTNEWMGGGKLTLGFSLWLLVDWLGDVKPANETMVRIPLGRLGVELSLLYRLEELYEPKDNHNRCPALTLLATGTQIFASTWYHGRGTQKSAGAGGAGAGAGGTGTGAGAGAGVGTGGCGWVEPTDPEDNLEPRSPVLCFRRYLHRVSNYRHRRSVTRLICGNLCPTTFRSSPGRCPKPDDIFDLKCCRACRQHYETPEHVLLQCLHVQEIVDLRRKFLSSVNIDPNLERSDSHCFELLKSLLFSWDRNACTSKFVNDVLKVWKDGNNIERDGEDSDDERE